MTSLTIALLLAAVALGVLAGAHYLGRSRKPWVVTLHLAAGALGAWLFFLLLHGRDGAPPGLVPGLLLGAAVLGGLLPRLIARRARKPAEWLLVAHVFTGLAAFLTVLSWSARL
ncbi:hypothetical protein [Paracraurococcus ruber]|uniref:Uncharacterized protein n=1 Tax=Paracraurococcus ruber TaxID=77675 RepID=A0ABS1CUF7_9PROT|nr:hypothetical protein [Paracraurococcus ruber]MBK1658045.1 hypothetical protein [Paracraurococcus ruber]TDG31736.1 hypothetical protein E2C05_09715 [Paracraurococcus ruber]